MILEVGYEENVQVFMRFGHYSRVDAEFIIAMEMGLHDGDIIEVERPAKPRQFSEHRRSGKRRQGETSMI